MNWYYAKNGTQQGPLPTEDMKSRIAMGEISPTDLAWCEGMADWMPVETIAALKVEAPPARVDDMQPPSPGAPYGAAPSASPEPYRPPSAAPAPGSVVPGQVPSQGLAIASMVCGILGIITCCIVGFLNAPLVIAAIVMGHIALSKIKADPARTGGKGMAKAGLITGYIGLLFIILLGVFLLMMGSMNPQDWEEKIIKYFPPEQQQQMREQFEQQRKLRGQ